MTIEDPIEYLHPHKNCLVNQREVGADTRSFKTALKYILRQDPDVVLVGEMRDLETIEAALVIAETGHICFATLHTNSAVQTINRVLDVFPPYQQPQVRAQLSFVLEGVMSQALIAKAGGPGRVLALEVMVPNPAIRNLIREDKVHQIYSSMQVGQAKFGMQTFNQALAALLSRRLITQDEAFGRSPDPDELRNILASGAGAGGLPGQRPSAVAGRAVIVRNSPHAVRIARSSGGRVMAATAQKSATPQKSSKTTAQFLWEAKTKSGEAKKGEMEASTPRPSTRASSRWASTRSRSRRRACSTRT